MEDFLVSKPIREVSIQNDTNDITQGIGHSKGHLPLSVQCVFPRVIDLMSIFLLECWKAKEGANQRSIVSVHDDTKANNCGPKGSFGVPPHGLYECRVVLILSS